jgi:hypothetical protein
MPTIGVKRDLLFKALGQEYSKLITTFVFSILKYRNYAILVVRFLMFRRKFHLTFSGWKSWEFKAQCEWWLSGQPTVLHFSGLMTVINDIIMGRSKWRKVEFVPCQKPLPLLFVHVFVLQFY